MLDKQLYNKTSIKAEGQGISEQNDWTVVTRTKNEMANRNQNNQTPEGQGETAIFKKRCQAGKVDRKADSNRMKHSSSETAYLRSAKTNTSRPTFRKGAESTQKAMTTFSSRFLNTVLYISQLFMI